MGQRRRVIVLTTRDAVGVAVARLAAVAGVTAEVAGPAAVRAAWRAADLLIVDSELADWVVRAELPRRAEVLVVSDRLLDDAEWRLGMALGATTVAVLPDDEAELIDRLAVAREPQPIGGRAIAVRACCGGAGASTLAAALALTAAAAEPTLLVDGDPGGGGLDVLLGIEQAPGPRWPELASGGGRMPSEAFASLPTVSRCAVLSWDRRGAADVDPGAAAAAMDAALRHYATVVVDLPRHLAPAAAALADAADLVILVVPATVRGTAAAVPLAAAATGRQLGLVVRRVGPSRLAATDIAEALGLPLWATVAPDAAIAAAAERGEVPIGRRSPLGVVCRIVLDRAARGSTGPDAGEAGDRPERGVA